MRNYKFIFLLIIILVPLVMLYFKYKDKKDVASIVNQPTLEFDGSDEYIYRKDFKSMVKLPFEIRKMFVSHDQKKLFVIGHDRDGFGVIDISNLENIRVLETFYYPKAKYSVENVDAVESRDGKFLYLVSPNLGFLKFDLDKFEIVDKFACKNCSKIELASDEKTAFIKHEFGVLSLNLNNMKEITNFNGCKSFDPIEKGDIALLNDDVLYMFDFCKIYVLDVKHGIKEINSISSPNLSPINIEISNDKSKIYKNSLNTFDIYDIKDFKAPVLEKSYFGSARIYEFSSFGYQNLVLITRNKDGGSDTTLPGFEILDTSGSADFSRVKNYFVTEARKTNAILLPDNKHMIVIIDVDFDSFIGVI